ncbi:hypothetical protein FSP39_013236 [Pinctada imbricata]|uniref:Major facilitator superfamily (MFS) profile domain-containing protein n=1 Tax=Pinctada imbricata TaxID=66713 RepID=A0AA88XFJ7_PINIB|nr:hypothetical protein FSP39_013236 [Pinctada imbricata]
MKNSATMTTESSLPSNCNHDNQITDKGNKMESSINETQNDDDTKCNHDNDSDSTKKKSTCLGMLRQKLSIVEPTATPVNWKMLGLIFVSLVGIHIILLRFGYLARLAQSFSSAFSLTFLFPFLPEMVVYFGYKEEDKGYYAGLVASAVFAGRAFGSYFWGWLSDKYGRRPVVMITVFGNGLCSLVFGFTINLPMAIATRFLTGLANGTVGTAKTILYEISDNTNQAVGMSILAMSWGAGVILGPTIGGLLAAPAKKYPDVFDPDGLFGQFPYLLPSLFVAGACFIVVVIDFFLLPETMVKNKEVSLEVKAEEKENVIESSNTNSQHINMGITEKASLLRPDENKVGLISMSVEDLQLEAESGTFQVKLARSREDLRRRRTFSDSKNHNGAVEPNDLKGSLPNVAHRSNIHNHNYSNLGSLPNVVIQMESESRQPKSVHRMVSCPNGHFERKEMDEKLEEKEKMIFVKEEEEVNCSKPSERKGIIAKIKGSSLFVLFRIPEVREAVMVYTVFSFAIIGFEEIFTVWASTKIWFAGLGFDPAEIGMALGITAAPMLLLNFYIFPFLVKKFDLKKTFIASSILNGIVITMVPALHLIHANQTALWVALMVLTIPQKILNSCCFSASSLFVNNSSPKHLAGAVNGIAMTGTAIARSLAPAIGGSVFAWSIGYGSPNIGPPFDVNLSFFMFGFILWLTGIYAIFLSESLNKQKNS